jgi:hypothetical protein
MRDKTHHPETIHRLRTMLAAWCGGPLSVKQMARLTGLTVTHPFQNAVISLYRTGEIERVARGEYRRKL